MPEYRALRPKPIERLVEPEIDDEKNIDESKNLSNNLRELEPDTKPASGRIRSGHSLRSAAAKNTTTSKVDKAIAPEFRGMSHSQEPWEVVSAVVQERLKEPFTKRENVEQSRAETGYKVREIVDRIDINTHLSVKTQVLRNWDREPWHAISLESGITPEIEQKTLGHQTSKDRADIKSIDEYKSLSRRDEDSERLDVTSVDLCLPQLIANELIELGPLEPETLKVLKTKYDYLDKHLGGEAAPGAKIESDKSDESRDDIFATSTDKSLEQRMQICPERAERAQVQIERIELIHQETQQRPSFQKVVKIKLESNRDNASYEMSRIESARFERRNPELSLKAILDERIDERLNQIDRPIYVGRPRLGRNERQDRSFITAVRRDLRKQELLVERLEDQEPEPGKFCTVGTVAGRTIFVRTWSARTIEEFDRTDPHAPATPCAINEIVKVDRDWKLWYAQRQHAREKLVEGQRQNVVAERDWDYEHDQDYDFER